MIKQLNDAGVNQYFSWASFQLLLHYSRKTEAFDQMLSELMVHFNLLDHCRYCVHEHRPDIQGVIEKLSDLGLKQASLKLTQQLNFATQIEADHQEELNRFPIWSVNYSYLNDGDSLLRASLQVRCQYQPKDQVTDAVVRKILAQQVPSISVDGEPSLMQALQVNQFLSDHADEFNQLIKKAGAMRALVQSLVHVSDVTLKKNQLLVFDIRFNEQKTDRALKTLRCLLKYFRHSWCENSNQK